MSEENASTQESDQIGSIAGNMAGSLLGNQENESEKNGNNDNNEEENENEVNSEEENENEVNNEEENENEVNNEEENENEENNEEENNNEGNNEEENQNESNNEEKNENDETNKENNLTEMADGLTNQLIGPQDNKSEDHAGSKPPTPSHSRSSQVRFSGNNSAALSQKSMNAISTKADNNNEDNDHSKTMPPPAIHEPEDSEGSKKSGRSHKSQKSNVTNQTDQQSKYDQAIQEEEDLYYSTYEEQEDIDDLVLSVITGETPIEKVHPSKLLDLITGLREARDERISRRKPDEAEVCDSCLLIARHAYNEHVKAESQKMKIKDIERRLEVAKEDLNNLRDNIDLEDAQQTSINENQVMDLLDRQHADVEEFRRSWRSPKKLRIYNRTSNQLRSLKTQTILLLNARKYSEMRQVDRLAKKQEEIETAENYQQMNSEYIQSHQNLERKHMEEMKTLIDSQETKNEQKRALAKKKLDIAQRRVDNLQAQYNELKDPNKVWNLYYRNQRSKAATKKSATRKRLETRNYATLALPPLQTPRSARNRSARYSNL